MNWYEPRVRSTHSIVAISNDTLVVRGARKGIGEIRSKVRFLPGAVHRYGRIKVIRFTLPDCTFRSEKLVRSCVHRFDYSDRRICGNEEVAAMNANEISKRLVVFIR